MCACFSLVSWLAPGRTARGGGNGGALQVELVIARATPQLASMLALLHLLALPVAVFAAPDILQLLRPVRSDVSGRLGTAAASELLWFCVA